MAGEFSVIFLLLGPYFCGEEVGNVLLFVLVVVLLLTSCLLSGLSLHLISCSIASFSCLNLAFLQ